MNESREIEVTRKWILDVVIGLNLCPFARRVFDANAIRFVTSEAENTTDLLDHLIVELGYLAACDSVAVETTLLIHPKVLTNFLDYNEFLSNVERMLKKSGHDQEFQIASFHPHYEFADATSNAVENYSNRSPYPMIHILRVDSVARVSGNEEQMQAIPAKNIETLRALGRAEVLRMLDRVTTKN